VGNVTKHGLVRATPESVYDYVADVAHAPEYISAFTHVISGPDPAGSPAVGQRYRVQASFLGNHVVLGLRVAKLEPGRLVELAMEGNPSGHLRIHLTPAHDGAATQVEATLDTPAFNTIMLNMVMGGVLEDALHRLNRTLRENLE
jgi:hypothetical protein